MCVDLFIVLLYYLNTQTNEFLELVIIATAIQVLRMHEPENLNEARLDHGGSLRVTQN